MASALVVVEMAARRLEVGVVTPSEEQRLIRILERVADSLERIEVKMCGERPKPEVPKDLKDVASAVRFHPDPRQQDSEFPSSTTTREKFWSEGDR